MRLTRLWGARYDRGCTSRVACANCIGDDLVSTVAAFAVMKRAERTLCALALVNLTVRALIGANLNSTGFVLAA